MWSFHVLLSVGSLLGSTASFNSPKHSDEVNSKLSVGVFVSVNGCLCHLALTL